MSQAQIWRMWFRKSGRRNIARFCDLVNEEDYERQPVPVMALPRPAHTLDTLNYDSDEFYDSEEDIISADECEQELPHQFFNTEQAEERDEDQTASESSETSHSESDSQSQASEESEPLPILPQVNDAFNLIDGYEIYIARLYELPDEQLLVNGDVGYDFYNGGPLLDPMEEEIDVGGVAAHNPGGAAAHNHGGAAAHNYGGAAAHNPGGAAAHNPGFGDGPRNGVGVAAVVPDPSAGPAVVAAAMGGAIPRVGFAGPSRRGGGGVRGGGIDAGAGPSARPGPGAQGGNMTGATAAVAAVADRDDDLLAPEDEHVEDDDVFAEAVALDPDDLHLPADFDLDLLPRPPRDFWIHREKMMCSQNENVRQKAVKLAEAYRYHKTNNHPNNFNIVLTGMSRKLHQKMFAACIALEANVQSQVDMHTTHVVLGSYGRQRYTEPHPLGPAAVPFSNNRCAYVANLRTMNALVGAAWGCKVVVSEWVKVSFSQGHWAPHRPYIAGHLADLYEKAQEKRFSLSNLGLPPRAYDIFHQKRVFVMDTAGRMYSSAVQLLALCGAEVCDELGGGDLGVGRPLGRRPRVLRIGTDPGDLAPNWVFDSVAASYMLDRDRYLIRAPN